MTGVTPPAGAAPFVGDGFGAAPHIPSPPALKGVIGSLGAKAAGLALRLRAGSGPSAETAADETFEIAVVDAAGAVLLALGPFAEDDVVATWRSLGVESGLPLVIARLDGSLHSPYPQIGRVALGPIRIRRRHGLLAGRRPRFLTRRKAGVPPRRPTVFRERELFGARV